jgi:hypothetical protein
VHYGIGVEGGGKIYKDIEGNGLIHNFCCTLSSKELLHV